ncbi:hypothetical protein SUGI_0126700 [Cryptomeria japonica]|uniref:protein NUCLEAR FUSION DEFECTIVE 4 n=1 Tax=Cryptomeria japonica TaxID=3369 RepID=UPI0024089504|nr:protein NUCLEAR FUSION DEFECTIVE 4 [Cryptomeria japonica]GLJ10353.1 hypothetical protein SUGI_0126700 [Cryptomeria japonica]
MGRGSYWNNSAAVKRCICMVAAIWLQSVNGTNFIFSNYSSDLKKTMGINQTRLNNLAVASDLGKFTGWVSGVVSMLFPTWAVLSIAMSLGMVGYGVQWFMLTQIIGPLAYWQVCMLCFLAGNSICWFNTVSFMAAVGNFPNSRGIASGLSTSYSGLSAVIYTCLSSVIDPGHPSSYLLLSSVVPAIVALISAILLHVSQLKMAKEEEGDKRIMTLFTLIAIVTVIYSILYEFIPHTNRRTEGIYMSVLIILLLSPLYVPLKLAFGMDATKTTIISNYNSSSRPIQEEHDPKSAERDNSIIHETFQENSITTQEAIDNTTLDIGLEDQQRALHRSSPSLGEEHSIKQLLSSIDFWLYYLVYFCGGTVGLIYINNLGQILQSLGYTKTPILVSLVSSFGFFGRIASGCPDYIQQWTAFESCRKMPRTAWIAIWMVPMSIAFFMMALLNPMSATVLYLSTAIVGTSSGAITSIAIPVSSELFGMEHFAVNHNIVVTNIALGSILFGEIAGIIYDSSGKGRHVCIGKQCFHKTFVLWGCVCSFGIILCVILCLRTRELYESIHRQRQNHN